MFVTFILVSRLKKNWCSKQPESLIESVLRGKVWHRCC